MSGGAKAFVHGYIGPQPQIHTCFEDTLDCVWASGTNECFCNWDRFSWFPCPFSETHPEEDPQDPGPSDNNRCNSTGSGSVITFDTQTLGEELEIVGTPFSLVYSSNRVKGYKLGFETNINLVGTSQAALKAIRLETSIAGQVQVQDFFPNNDQFFLFQWDGKDGQGVDVEGLEKLEIRIAHGYGVLDPLCFGCTTATDIFANTRITRSFNYTVSLGAITTESLGLGGWMISDHHFYDQKGKNLYRGDGTQRTVESQSLFVTPFAGEGTPGVSDPDGETAINTSIDNLLDVLISPSDEVFFLEETGGRYFIRRIDPVTSIVTTVAGSATSSTTLGGGNSAPATSVNLGAASRIEYKNNKVYLASNIGIYSLSGSTLTHLVGDFFGQTGEGIPAISAKIFTNQGLAIDGNGDIYYAEDNGIDVFIRQVDVSTGLVNTVAGDGFFTGDLGAVVSEMKFHNGMLYVNVQSNIQIIDFDTQMISTFFPSFPQESECNDLSANNFFKTLWDFEVLTDGSLVTVEDKHIIRKYLPNKTVRKIFGQCDVKVYAGDSGFAGLASASNLRKLTASSDGVKLFFTDQLATGGERIRGLDPVDPALGPDAHLVASEDSSEIYVFDDDGNHLKTLYGNTGVTKYTFSYSVDGKLDSITDAFNNVTSLTRTNGNLSSITSPKGLVTTITTNTDGYIDSVTNPENETHNMTYWDDQGLLKTFQKPEGQTSNFTYDSKGRLMRDTNPEGGFTDLAVNFLNGVNEITVSTAEGIQTVITNENLQQIPGFSKVITNPDQTQTVITNNQNKREILIEESSGRKTTLTQLNDINFGAMSTTQNVLINDANSVKKATINQTKTSAEDFFGGSVEVKISNSFNDAFTFTDNKDIRSITISSPEGRLTHVDYDEFDRPIRIRVPSLLSTFFKYNTDGSLKRIYQGNRDYRFIYEPGTGFVNKIKNQFEDIVNFTNDSAGRLIKEKRGSLLPTIYGRDLNGRVISIRPPGKPAHLLTYDGNGNELTYIPPTISSPSGVTQSIYNLDQLLVNTILPSGSIISYTYDPQTDQLLQIANADGNLNYTYSTSTGLLETVSSPDLVTNSFSYEGTFMSSDVLSGSVNGQIEFSYDDEFRFSSFTINGLQSQSIVNSYDKDGLLSTVGSMSIERHPLTGHHRNVFLGGMHERYIRNDYGDIETHWARYNGNHLIGRTYTYDERGRIISDNSIQYEYDSASRLVKVTKGSLITDYIYDDNGNRISRVRPSETLVGSYNDQDQLESYGRFVYTYDQNGMLESKTDTISSETTGYSYDNYGNLKSVSLPSGDIVGYLYDGLNRRVGKTLNGVFKKGWLYLDEFSAIAELDENQNVSAIFGYAIKSNVPDFIVKGGATYKVFSDVRGSVRMVVDSQSGVVVQQIDYDEYGVVEADTNPGFQPFGYTGGIYDHEIGIVHISARDYDPYVGRWLSKDPVRFQGDGPNLYTYTLNDPINFIDLTGLTGSASLFIPNTPTNHFTNNPGPRRSYRYPYPRDQSPQDNSPTVGNYCRYNPIVCGQFNPRVPGYCERYPASCNDNNLPNPNDIPPSNQCSAEDLDGDGIKDSQRVVIIKGQ